MANIGLLITKLNGGGAERTVSNLSEIFAKYQHNVYIILFDGENISYTYSGNLIDLHEGTNHGVFDMLKKNFNRIKKIKKIKKKYKLDVVISFLDTPNLLNVLTKSKNCKTITSVRNNLSSEDKSWKKKVITRFTCNNSDLIVAISETVKYDLMNYFKIYGTKIVTIYNPINIDKLLLNEKEYDAFPNDFNEYYNIVTMGRLTYQKGQWHLIRCMKNVIEKNNKIRLYILGEGILDGQLKKMVKDLKLENHIIFLGFIDNPHKFMKKCNLFILPSLFEGLGNVILEAMALGLPVISTDCNSGPREIMTTKCNYDEQINDVMMCEYGCLVPPFPIEKDIYMECEEKENILTKAIFNLVNNREKQDFYRKQSLIRVTQFSDEKIYNEWIKVIE